MDGITPLLLALIGLAIGLLILGGYIVALVNAAQTEQWVWFVLMLLFPIVVIVYFLAGYRSPPVRRSGRSRRYD